MNKQQMVSWVKEHKKELIIGGVVIGVAITTAIVLKKPVKAKPEMLTFHPDGALFKAGFRKGVATDMGVFIITGDGSSNVRVNDLGKLANIIYEGLNDNGININENTLVDVAINIPEYYWD